ncbi:MAG TPA: hypothetical protein PK733_03290 [Clostridiales bacterium]|nr:hypothetical protein [Clostridiales bacterium]
MSPFYTIFLIVGLIMLIVCTFLILEDRKKFINDMKQMEEKEKQLSEIVMDAEYMVDELNKLSDFIIDRIEEKKNELDIKINNISTQINFIEEKAGELSEKLDLVEKYGEDSRQDIDNSMYAIDIVESCKNNKIKDINDTNSGIDATSKGKIKQGAIKNFTVNKKYEDVILLLEKGMNEAEIARTLNIGRGEVHLVLQLMM